MSSDFDTTFTRVGSIKVGRFIVDESGEPARVIQIDHSKPGKHGSAKARMVLVGLFSGQKKQFLAPVDKKVQVPIINKRTGTVISLSADSVTVMDSETFESIEIPYPDEPNDKSRLEELFRSEKGCSLEYWEVMGSRIVNVVREGSG